MNSSSIFLSRALCLAVLTTLVFEATLHAASVTWDGSCGTNRWFECCPAGEGLTDSNWNRGTTSQSCSLLLPQSADSVFIGANDVLVDCCATAVAHTLTTGGPFTIHDGTLDVGLLTQFNGPLVCENAALRTGVFRANGDLTVRNSGSPSGLRLEAGARLEMSGGGLMDGSDSLISIANGGLFTIEPGRMLECGENQQILISTGSFFVAGEFRKSTGAGDFLVNSSCTLSSNCGFQNHGFVAVGSGGLRINASGEDAGEYNIAAGAEMSFGVVERSVYDGARFTGDGLVRTDHTRFFLQNNATMTISRLSGPCDFRSDIPGAQLSVEHELATDHMLLFRTAMYIGPDANATLASPLIWGSPVEVDGRLTLTGGPSLTSLAPLRSEIIVNKGGLLDLTGLQSANVSGSPAPRIVVNGMCRKSTVVGATCPIGLDNHGSLEVLQGQLNLGEEGTHSGSFNLAPNTTLIFSRGRQTLLSGTSFSGGGRLALSADAFLTIDGDASVRFDGVRVNAFTVDNFIGTISMRGASSMRFNPLQGEGSTIIEPGATVRLEASSTAIRQRFLNHGTFQIDAANALTLQLNAFFSNESDGTLELSGGGRVVLSQGSTAYVVNKGTLRRLGPGASDLPGDLRNEGVIDILGGTLRIDASFSQTAGGSILLNGGELASLTSSAVTLNGGRLAGNGLIKLRTLNNAGAVLEPGSPIGGLKLTGFLDAAYIQGASGTLAIDIAGTEQQTGYDVFKVAGVATLGGTLKIIRADGFTPPPGGVYSILECGQRVGEFDHVVLENFPKGTKYTVKYESNRVLLGIN